MRRQLNNHGEYVMNAINNTKHTPGPWQIVDHVPSRLRISINHTDPINEVNICSLYGNGEDEEIKANAKLISGSPNLLEELKNMVFAFSGYANEHGSTIQKKAIEYANAAIQKVTE
jgi:hypothetical protein